MSHVTQDIFTKPPLDVSPREEIRDLDWQAHQTGAARVSEEVLIHSLEGGDIARVQRPHYRSKIPFVDRAPLVANVKCLTGIFLVFFRFFIGPYDSLQDHTIIAP